MDNHNGAIRGLAFGSISIDEKSCYVGDHKKLPAPKYQALPMLANGASYPDQADQALQAETPKDEHNFEYIAIVIDGDTEISTDVDMEHFANHRKSVTPGGFSIQKPLLGSKSPLEIGNAVVSILERYRQVPKTRRPQAWQAREKFLTLIQEHVERGEAIPMVLPAFPFKSPNKTYKVLGRLPDKAEELALLHLDELCKEIGEVYHNGAKIDIVSDGLMYNGMNIQMALFLEKLCSS